jgi:hypothetical protein
MSPRSNRDGGSEPEAAEPRAAPGLVPLEEGDFHALSEGCARDPQYNDRRLVLRRKLLGLGRLFVERARGEVELDVRTSLHHPHSFNAMQVRRQWAYICRPKTEKSRLRRVLGADLARDLDAAYRNAYLCVAVESEAVETSFRIHAEAWFDGQNLVKRVAAEGLDGWRGLLNRLDGYRLRLADWRGEWPCGVLERERLEEFLRYYTPGEHALSVERRWPASPGPARAALLGLEFQEQLVAELLRLLPLYRFATWSSQSDFLFARP